MGVLNDCGLLISTHATHKGGDNTGFQPFVVTGKISTHATHKGGDNAKSAGKVDIISISTHATHKGGDDNG